MIFNFTILLFRFDCIITIRRKQESLVALKCPYSKDSLNATSVRLTGKTAEPQNLYRVKLTSFRHRGFTYNLQRNQKHHGILNAQPFWTILSGPRKRRSRSRSPNRHCPRHANIRIHRTHASHCRLRSLSRRSSHSHPLLTAINHLTNIQVEVGHTIAQLRPRHEAYILEAVRLQQKYKDQIKILIGFEADWIRPSYALLIHELASNPAVDFFIGSVHHVNEIPIDYDASFFEASVVRAGGSEEKLFEDYFNEQFEMLQALKPRVVGHFDLIRLMSKEKDADLRVKGEKVWEKVVRNLRVIVESEGLLEINSAGLRKGLKEPYPGRAICEVCCKSKKRGLR